MNFDCVAGSLVYENPGGAVVLSSAAALSLERVDATTSGPGKVGRIYAMVGEIAIPMYIICEEILVCRVLATTVLLLFSSHKLV